MITRSDWFRRLAVVTAVVTYLLIVMGGIVRVTGSGLGCGVQNQWPLCNGALLPSAQTATIIEFTHRWLAALATILVVVLAGSAWITQRQNRRVVFASTLAAALFVVQIGLGALAVEYALPGGVVMIHLANALLLLGVLVYIAVIATPTRTVPAGADEASQVRRVALVTVAATFLLALSGALVVETGSGGGCAGWPLCGNGFQLASGQAATVNLVHRIVAAVVVIVVGGAMALIRRRRRDDRSLRIGAIAVNALLLLQVAAGAVVVELRLPAGFRALHIALASALWGMVVLVAVMAGWRQPAPVLAPEGSRSDPLRSRAGMAPL